MLLQSGRNWRGVVYPMRLANYRSCGFENGHDWTSESERVSMFSAMVSKLTKGRAEARADQREAFTLIELLVVIAIIAILAAMLLPALNRGKAQALSTACKNHLHEMGLALNMYVEDAKAYPYSIGGRFSPPSPLTVQSWPDALAPYYKIAWTNQSYHCPAYRGIVYGKGYFDIYGSYSYNGIGVGSVPVDGQVLGLGAAFDAPGYPPIRDSEVIVPSQMFAMMDCRGGPYPNPSVPDGFYGSIDTTCYPARIQPKYEYAFQKPAQHGDRFNVVFCDAHVKAIKIEDLFSAKKSAQNWNRDNQPHPESWTFVPPGGF
ncbi:MAG TPA: prepilin-type N-terminal cleavage/methylation domain-containing protein [Verrucomicrobiae bacterium]|nr:prepilin-type N-terminal cleavage/methylation domain-containing protein [Verrucomicrobiae bacterium]